MVEHDLAVNPDPCAAQVSGKVPAPHDVGLHPAPEEGNIIVLEQGLEFPHAGGPVRIRIPAEGPDEFRLGEIAQGEEEPGRVVSGLEFPVDLKGAEGAEKVRGLPEPAGPPGDRLPAEDEVQLPRRNGEGQPVELLDPEEIIRFFYVPGQSGVPVEAHCVGNGQKPDQGQRCLRRVDEGPMLIVHLERKRLRCPQIEHQPGSHIVRDLGPVVHERDLIIPVSQEQVLERCAQVRIRGAGVIELPCTGL